MTDRRAAFLFNLRSSTFTGMEHINPEPDAQARANTADFVSALLYFHIIFDRIEDWELS